MPEWSRRRALQAAASLAAVAAAGCNADTTRDRVPDEPPRERVTDYEARKARSADGEPFVRLADRDRGDDRHGYLLHLTGEGDRYESLTYRTDTDEAATFASFVRDTDFDSESVYLNQRPIGECYEMRLVSVTRDDDGVSADFCRELRPADVACDSEREATVAVAIRLPFAGDSFNSVGGGYGSDCHREPLVDFGAGSGQTAADDGVENATGAGTGSEGGRP